jgi:outer membrane protein assembly factor BamE (lipoprotein component of BamABCDE complex)
MRTRQQAILALAALLALSALAGCDPTGQPCNRAGDVKVYHGTSHTCVHKRDGLVWS